MSCFHTGNTHNFQTNSADPDQTSKNAVSDQDAHCSTFHYHLLHTSPDSQMDFNVLDNSKNARVYIMFLYIYIYVYIYVYIYICICICIYVCICICIMFDVIQE